MSEKEKIYSELQFSELNSLVAVRCQTGQTASNWLEGNSNLIQWVQINTNNHSIQPRYAAERLWMQNMLNLEAEDDTSGY